MSWVRLSASLAAVVAAASTSPTSAQVNAARLADERVISQGESAWGQAYVTGDVPAVERLLDDSFLGVDTRGAEYGKAAVVREVRNGPHATSDEVRGMKVRFYGNAAIAQAHEFEVGPAPDRNAREQVFTDTWRKIGGRWRIVAAADVPIVAVTAPAAASLPKNSARLISPR
ncbi:MAG: nuclear transport factor 2 family protein [Caulobacteraceae bacterium]